MSKRKTVTVQPFPPSPAHEDKHVHVSTHPEGQTLPETWSSEAYARWFFDFLRTDLTTLTPGQLHGVCADAWAFSRPEIVVDTPWAGELPPVVVLEALQREAHAGIQRVRDGGGFQPTTIGYSISRLGQTIIKDCRRGTFDDLFRASVMDVLQACWLRVFTCPHCQAFFLKVGKQKFCSSQCANRAHWKAFKTKRGARDYHRDYTRRVQKRLDAKGTNAKGTNAKVTIKPRRRT